MFKREQANKRAHIKAYYARRQLEGDKSWAAICYVRLFSFSFSFFGLKLVTNLELFSDGNASSCTSYKRDEKRKLAIDTKRFSFYSLSLSISCLCCLFYGKGEPKQKKKWPAREMKMIHACKWRRAKSCLLIV